MNSLTKNNGYTITEILVGTMVLSIVAVVSSSLMLANFDNFKRLKQLTEAKELVQQVRTILTSSTHCSINLTGLPISTDPGVTQSISEIGYAIPDPGNPGHNKLSDNIKIPVFALNEIPNNYHQPLAVVDFKYSVVSNKPLSSAGDVYLGQILLSVQSKDRQFVHQANPIQTYFKRDSTGAIAGCQFAENSIIFVEKQVPTHSAPPTTPSPASNPVVAATIEPGSKFLYESVCELKSGGLETYDPSLNECAAKYEATWVTGSYDTASCPSGQIPYSPDPDGSFDYDHSRDVCNIFNRNKLTHSQTTSVVTNYSGQNQSFSPYFETSNWSYSSRSCSCQYANEVTNPQVGLCVIKCYDPSKPIIY